MWWVRTGDHKGPLPTSPPIPPLLYDEAVRWQSTREAKEMLLNLHNVYAGYEGGDVLKGIDLQVEQGTTTCIVGPNGAGKSTVLRVLSGLLRPRLGEISFDGRSIGGLAPRQILALGIV